MEELKSLAEQIASGPPDVVAAGEEIAALYRKERMAVTGLAGINSMVSGRGQDPNLDGPRERMRDRMKTLLAWAKETGRM